jgi:hypothetical protein
MSSRTAWQTLAAFALVATGFGRDVVAQELQWSRTGDHLLDDVGTSVVVVPDVDGDGVSDVLVGAGATYESAGKVHLYSGATRTELRAFDGALAGDAFGWIVADLGDVNGDGVRDFAAAAPGYYAGSSFGAIVVESGAGVALRTITSSSPNGVVGFAMSYVGDVDGDGVRELLYGDQSGSTTTFWLVSGATGATIRSHTVNALVSTVAPTCARAGDVDGDGTDDYMITDPNDVYVHSGATGALLFTVAHQATVVAAAGDVDGDLHADLLLAEPFDTATSGRVRVVSGATGTELYSLTMHGQFGAALSATGDVDGDGLPDFVVTRQSNVLDPLYDGHDVFVFAGATGTQLAAYGVDPHLNWVDASADLDGDGVADAIVGDWLHFAFTPFDPNGAFDPQGEVDVVSLVDGSRVATVTGSAFASSYGQSTTLVGDRDGDGWRDVAIAAPGGLDVPGSAVRIASGRDGHELSRFTTSGVIPLHDRTLVAIGDVNGDGVADLAVACPDAQPGGVAGNGVELRSGADDSRIATLVPSSGTPNHLAAAADVNGTPLLAVTTTSPSAVLVYDLTTNQVVTNYAGSGDADVACVGDVDHDGVVDWVVLDTTAPGGTVRLFSGGGSPQTLWSFSGAATAPIEQVVTTGDLDGDGLDDVLVAEPAYAHSAGKVVGLSGASGSKLFELTGSFTNQGLGHQVASVGDVNRDGVCDFVVGQPASFVVESGRTLTKLYDFDLQTWTDSSFANLRWHDDARVDPDRIPDVVLSAPGYDLYRGRVDVHRLDDLMLQVDPPSPAANSTVTCTTRGGPAGNLVGLYALDLSGVPLDFFLALGTFNSKGNFAVSDTVPSSLQGLTLDVVSYGVGFNGKLADSETTAVAVQ